MLVLGIETTCDETAAAVVERTGDGWGKILSNIVLSQLTEHAAFGGVGPEIAARADGAARVGDPISVLPVPRLRRAHPDPSGPRRRRLHPARHHPGRRHRRSFR